MSAAIQPETRLSVILEKHPELEQRLLTALPPLASVRSEAMRRSLLEGTTLESAARLAGLPVPEFVHRPRVGGRGARRGRLRPRRPRPPSSHAAPPVGR